MSKQLGQSQLVGPIVSKEAPAAGASELSGQLWALC